MLLQLGTEPPNTAVSCRLILCLQLLTCWILLAAALHKQQQSHCSSSQQLYIDDVLRVSIYMQMAAEASIPEASKLYCPYPKCSTLMVADERGPNMHAECPACHRMLCLWCRTPWHQGQTCGEAKVYPGSAKGKKETKRLCFLALINTGLFCGLALQTV